MASTRTLQDTARWAATFTKLVPIIGVGGFQQEPALTICNNVLQEMIAAPFNWRFNSIQGNPFLTSYCNGSSGTGCTTNAQGAIVGTFQQDYLQNYSDIAWIENATYTEVLNTTLPKPVDILEVAKNLQVSSVVGPPQKIGHLDETDDTVTFRLWPVPPWSNQWQIDFRYQKKPPIKQGLQDTWAPFPDELAYVYNQGFLAMAYKQADDPRYLQEYLKFLQLMRTALGINDMEADGSGFYPQFGLFVG
jgi:hypothetical protein